MSRFICLHGHFYQPPRENPWLEEVELQDSAYPYHDWNQRVTAESYAPNAASRILNDKKKIVDIVNNYAKISFNFGPTLLSWIERNEPWTYQSIMEADNLSREKFSGHGAALAQCYNHMIMPLATKRDKQTQIIWGLKDFEKRFQRKPEGMWLPETAVDAETLEILAEQGVVFTILAPHQAKSVRKSGEKEWQDVDGARIDPRRSYVCHLPSGKTINIFFYDGPISRNIAFEGLLQSGEDFAQRLIGAFREDDENQLVNIATDGETYGHHHYKGDMALAYCLNFIDDHDVFQLTIYGEYLEKFPPEYEVAIYENTSWSCVHGIERWRNDCGCNSGAKDGWSQGWRMPLRGSLEWLRDNLILVYEEEIAPFIKNPWLARDEYIDVVLDRSSKNAERFLAKHAAKSLNHDEKVKVLKLFEMQRHAMLMFTSCGWFFDEISGIETTQIMQYASRAIQLTEEVSEMSFEKTFITLLERAGSNISKYKDGANIYNQMIKPTKLDLVRVGAHYAVSSLFEKYEDNTEIYCYTATNQMCERLEVGKQKLATGKALIQSRITWEQDLISFAVLHLGDHNLMGGVRGFVDDKLYGKMYQEIHDSFCKNDVGQTMHLIEKHFSKNHYSLWHLFKDEQTKILYQILDSTMGEIEVSLRQINEHHYPIIQVIKQLNIPLPKMLANTVLVMINTDLLKAIGSEIPDFVRLKELVDEVKNWSLEIDKVTLEFVSRRKINNMMDELAAHTQRVQILEIVETLLRILHPLSLDIDLWKAQNVYFTVGKNVYFEMKAQSEQGHENAQKWIAAFDKLGEYLQVKVL
ncbi:MAG: DUF3536 domain-containing protein [Candidatus Omnitrophica bacterium]|nr:DUF3536 domain-containing protein [Candidatus Omnitrophota bacterium]